MSLVHLEGSHPAIRMSIDRVLRGENVVPHTCVRDFDGCEYYIVVEPIEGEVEKEGAAAAGGSGSASLVTISLRHVVDVKLLDRFGTLRARLAAALPWKRALLDEPEDPSFVCTVAAKSTSKDFDAIVEAASKLRVTALCAPLFAQFDAFLKDSSSGSGGGVVPLALPYRAGESMYIYSPKGNLCVTLTINVEDRDDNLFVRNFLQTFADAKKLEKSLSAAPGFSYFVAAPPPDLPKGLALEAESDALFWVTFQLFKKQIEKPSEAERTVRSLADFRNYVAYHVRCCRSNMHAKMRERVELSMKVLNRAKTRTTGRARVQIK